LLALLVAHPTLRAIHGVGTAKDPNSGKTRATVTIRLADGSRKTVRRPGGYVLGPFTTWGGEGREWEGRDVLQYIIGLSKLTLLNVIYVDSLL
jgi:hypothetical protein